MSKLLREILDMSKCPKNPVVTFYDRDDIKIGSTSNDVEFEYIRLQIAKNEIDGCYLTYNGEKYQIDSNGQLKYWPKGLFDTVTDLIGDILQFDFKGPMEGSTIINERDCPKNDWVEIFDNEDKIITRTNLDLEFNWVRAEIKEKKLKGCYLVFRGERIEINENGDPCEYPNGLFDENGKQLCRLL
jgi:hypothetical protein